LEIFGWCHPNGSLLTLRPEIIIPNQLYSYSEYQAWLRLSKGETLRRDDSFDSAQWRYFSPGIAK
jgi:hypothetical protein